MGKSLLVVESPAKARTLSRYVDPSFAVVATVGHIKDLPPRELGVDIENEFQPKYSVISGKWKVIKELRSATEKVDAVYLAPDPDREGEAIAWHVAEEVAGEKKTLRVMFHEITKKAVQNALQNPIVLDRHKYDAQQARRILDRLVGYLISPILWRKVRRGLSAGRVQSVAVRLICEREEEIRRFESKEYWTVHALLEGSQPPAFRATLLRIKGKKANVPNEEHASRIKEGLEAASFRAQKIEKKRTKRNPPPPFITSTLQQEASRACRFTPKRTMKIAQKLYEGVSLGDEGPEGLITYMRTDSTRISQEAIQQASSFIQGTLGPSYLPASPRVYRPKKKKNIQDAHEAIRPTSVDREPSKVKSLLTKEQHKLYELIWKRSVACQMKPAELDQTRVDIEAGDCLFRATGSVLRFDGYRKLYEETSESDAKGKVDDSLLPELKEGEVLAKKEVQLEQHFTQPPPRYTESSLIKVLEEKGIGRPSTYAAILSNIRDRQYVDLLEGRLSPSELGELVNRLLVDNFPDILNVEFTANMESSLDAIELGEKDWLQVLKAFYEAFEKDLERAKDSMLDVRKEGTPTEIRCEQCSKPMVIRFSAAGPFLACSGFPECKNAKSFDRDENGKIRIREEETYEEQSCPECELPLQVKHGKFGPFLACTGYPECRYTRPLDGPGEAPGEETEGEEQPCEKCGGKLVVKRSRSGNRFWACSNYPRCKGAKPYRVGVPCDRCDEGQFVERASRNGRIFYCCDRYPDCKNTLPNRPVPTACEACGAPHLLTRVDKEGKTILYCARKECPAHRGVPFPTEADSAEQEPCPPEKS